MVAKQLHQKSVEITWKKPKNVDDRGFKEPLTYTVKCYLCTNVSWCDTVAGHAIFDPAEEKFNKTYVVISNLTFNVTYKVKVFSMSSLKNVSSDKWKFAVINFTIKGL